MTKTETKNLIPDWIPDTQRRLLEYKASKYEHRISGGGSQSLFYAVRFFCYSVLAYSLLVSFASAGLSSNPGDAQTGETAPADLTAREAERSSQDNPHSAPEASSLIVHRLWRSRVSIPENQEETKAKNELKHLIEQIRSVRFEIHKQTPEHVIATESVSRTEPNEALSAPEMPRQLLKKDMRSKPDKHLTYEPVSNQTLQVLENLSQHPDRLHNPLELADILFLSRHPKQAVRFYQHALGRISPDNFGSAQDRAWVLFQIGNCLRDDDLASAGEMYRRLITEYPDSPWVDLSKARLNIIDWYQKSEPQTLIAECRIEAPQPPGS